jgi:hypothetical protein
MVRASQPFFICQICFGTFLAACSVIPLALQEPAPVHLLDVSCMLSPWLLSSRLCIVIAALVSKVWRLNKLFGGDGKVLRYISVKPKEVMRPLILLGTVNIGLLSAWTVVAPFSWQRIPISFDQYGRTLESYGKCMPDSSVGEPSSAFSILIAVANGLVLLFACFESYKARNVPTMFNESTHIAVAIFGLLEFLLIAVPLVLVLKDPTSYFVVQSRLCRGSFADLHAQARKREWGDCKGRC